MTMIRLGWRRTLPSIAPTMSLAGRGGVDVSGASHGRLHTVVVAPPVALARQPRRSTVGWGYRPVVLMCHLDEAAARVAWLAGAVGWGAASHQAWGLAGGPWCGPPAPPSWL